MASVAAGKKRSCMEDVNSKRKKKKERLKSIVKLANTYKGIQKMSKKHGDWFQASSELLKKW